MEDPAEDDNGLAALMRLAQAGDRVAYDRVLRRCADLVRRRVRAHFPHLPRADAEDLVQDVLLSLHRVRATYDASRPFVPWLMAIAHNRTVDMVRRYARLSAGEVAVDEYPETSGPLATNMPDEKYRDPEALRQALTKLPEGQRVAIELLKLREMSLKDASKASGMSVAALKVATHRATRALRLVLQAGEDHGH